MEITKFNLVATITVVISGCFSKVSICLFLLRLLDLAAARKRIHFLYLLILILVVYNFIEVIIMLVQCKPTTKIWNRKIEGSCWKPTVQEGFANTQGGLFGITLVNANVLILYSPFSLRSFCPFDFSFPDYERFTVGPTKKDSFVSSYGARNFVLRQTPYLVLLTGFLTF